MKERCKKIIEAINLLEKEGVDLLYSAVGKSTCFLSSEIFLEMFPREFQVEKADEFQERFIVIREHEGIVYKAVVGKNDLPKKGGR